jgi:uncharacterized protein (TIGR02271 family)
MTQNIVSAVFDNHSAAESAVRELRSAGVRDSALSVIARRDEGGGDYGGANTHEVKEKGEGMIKGALGGAGVGALLGIAALAIPGVGPLAAAGAIASTAIPEAAAIGAGAGALAGGLTGLLTKHGVSEEDAKYYEGRINSGGVFVSVDTSDGAISADAAREMLHRNGGHSSSQPRAAMSSGSQEHSIPQDRRTETAGSATAGRAVEEERIPLVEEELRVGTREVERGGVAVHSHVVEQPVQEQVTLREEHVSVERRPVDETRSSDSANADNLLRERTIEMTARSEEPVVEKQAQVREEIVVRKTAEERTENIQDSVRRTEVNVEEGAERSGSAFGFSDEGQTRSGSGDDSRDHERTGYSDRVDKSGL